MNWRRVNGVLAGNKQILRYVEKPSEASFKDAAIAAVIVAGVTYTANLLANLTWEGGRYLINKIKGKEEEK